MARDEQFYATLMNYAASANGVASLDSTGNVPASQLGNVPGSGNPAIFPSSVTIGTASSRPGVINLLNASNSNVAAIAAGATTAAYTLTWPTAAGGLNQVLTTNGAPGQLSFATPTAGVVKAVIVCARSPVAAGTERFFGSANASATEGDVPVVAPFAGTVKNLYLRTGSVWTGSGSAAFVRKNAVNTTVTTSAVPNTANTSYTDLTHSFTVAAGDLLNLDFQSAVATGDILGSWQVEIDAS